MVGKLEFIFIVLLVVLFSLVIKVVNNPIQNTQEQDDYNIDYIDYYRVSYKYYQIPQNPSCSLGYTYCNGRCWTCPKGYILSCPSSGNATCNPPKETQRSIEELIPRYYEWDFGSYKWSWNPQFPKSLYTYYRSKVRTYDYSEYVTDEKDDIMLNQLIDLFRKASAEKGFNKYETINFVISFVQNLPYTSDDVTTPYDNYPRYPIETLVDNGGDCEDTSILTASLLKEMGYDVVLLNPSGHMAIGVRCDTCSNTISYEGRRYAYLETTVSGWKIGDIPKEYQGVSVRIIPLF